MWAVASIAVAFALGACESPPPDARDQQIQAGSASVENPAVTNAPAAAQSFDVIIEGGRVVDGTGAAWFYGDVAVQGDRIAAITPAGILAEVDATIRIDAEGMVVAPGFIDIQSHSRGPLLTGDGRLLGKITQGITTEIMGEGWTNAPVNANTNRGAGMVDPEARSERLDFSGAHGFDRWLNAMLENGSSPNFGSFVGATTIRVYAKGEMAGAATTAELDTMRAATRRAMEDGAFGVASALVYPPGNFASTEELAEVVAATAEYGGLYITHLRSEGDDFLDGIDEAIEIGQRAGVPVEIYHLKAAGQRNHYKAALAIAKIDSARSVGVDVQANMYPYIAGGTGLSALFPPWASENGKLLDNLADPEVRQRVHDEVLADETDWENFGALARPEGVMVTAAARTGPDGEPNGTQRYVGKRLSEIAQEMGVDWVDAAINLTLMTGGNASMVVFMMTEENVALQLQQPWMKIGTDAGGHDPSKAVGMVHPRSYGTYPRILGKYVRDENVITLEDAVRKMTSAVATRLSIHDRGLLKTGMYADIVVFNAATITDHATFEEPHQLSTGVEYVFVNGLQVVRAGEHTGAKPGRIVRGPGYKPAN